MGRGFWKARQRDVELLLDEAEGEGRCAIAGKRQRDLLRRRQLAGDLVRPFPSAFMRRETWEGLSPEGQCLAVIRTVGLLHPDWLFCNGSAALVHGLEVPCADPGVVCVTGIDGAGGSSSLHVRRHTLKRRWVLVDGLRVTDYEQTVTDCLGSLGFARGLAVADSHLRKSGDTVDGLSRLVRESQLMGAKRSEALRTAYWADGLSENGGESFARARMLQLGFARPALQVPIADPVGGGRTFRVDYLWTREDGTRIAGELDGREKYWREDMTGGRSAVDVLCDERLRASRLSMAGVMVVRFSFAQAARGDELARILTAAGVPRRVE